MAISASDIQKIVDTEDDFGHEMLVGAAIRAIASCDTQHSGTYTDRVTGKPRQFDYRCSLTKETNAFEIQIPANGCTGAETGGRRPREITDDAIDVLMRYAWPGNVRELRNVIERIVIMNPTTFQIGRAHV